MASHVTDASGFIFRGGGGEREIREIERYIEGGRERQTEGGRNRETERYREMEGETDRQRETER